MEKSYVGMLHEHCPICLFTDEEKSSILLDRRLKDSLEKDNSVISDTPCKKCKELLDSNMVAMVVIKNDGPGEKVTQSQADRDGEILWIKREVFSNIFDDTAKIGDAPMVFIDTQARDSIKENINIQTDNSQIN